MELQHPPVTKYVAGLGAQWADGFGPARALSALMVAIACALMVPIGRRLFSLRVGIIAALTTALTPHLIAHSKIVGHEAPMILFWTLAVWLCLRAFEPPGDEPELDPRLHQRALAFRFAVIGIVLGLAIWSRFSNLLLAPLIGTILLLQAPPEQRKRTIIFGLTILPLAAIAVGFLLWPRLWSEPITHLQESWAKLKLPHTAEPFLGQMTAAPPRYYFAVYLVATAPLGLLLGVVAWLGRSGWRRERANLVLLLWLIIPLLILISPVRQDGVRYIMPSLIALALASAAGFDFLADLGARLASRRSPRGKRLQEIRRPRLFCGIAGALVLYLAVVNVRVHPYYLDYYGEHYGGPASVAANPSFEIAWWGEGLADAVEYVNREADEKAPVHARCIEPFAHLGWFRADLWARRVSDPDAADWIVVYQPALRSCAIPAAFSLAYQVSCQGAPLARVYRRDSSAASPAASPDGARRSP